MGAIGVGYTPFTHYPLLKGETNIVCPHISNHQHYDDSTYKIIDLIVRCNERSTSNRTVLVSNVVIQVPLIKALKDFARSHMEKVEETKKVMSLF
jgi:hypothetical protein